MAVAASAATRGTELAPATRRLPRVRQIAWSIAALALAALLIEQIALVGDFRVDDAYITFSFSKNLASGHGPIFSHGLRVEGYSNFLWMVLVSLGYLLAPRADPYVTARLWGFAALTFCVFAVYRLTRRSAGSAAALLAVLLLLSCTDVVRAATSGIETAAYIAAIAGGWLAYLSEPKHRRKWSLLAFVPAALLRIDGFVPLLIVVFFEVASAYNERRFSIRVLARWVAPAFGIWLVYFAWRFSYYGLPLPTTYYAKTMVTANEPARGLNQLWGFAKDYGLLAVLPLALAPLFIRRTRDALGLATAVALQLAYVVRVGGDWMPFERFFLPVVPLGAVLVASGSERVLQETRALRAGLRGLSRLCVLAALAFMIVHAHALSVDTPEEADKLGNAVHVAQHTRDNLLASVDLMRYVSKNPGERLVTDYAGVFSVYTDADIIDMWGLCNADIALHGGISGINPIYGKECAECYARIDPDYFHVVVPIVRGVDAFTNQQAVINDVFQGWAIDRVIGLQRNFVVGRVVESASGRALWFLERVRGARPHARSPVPGIRVEYPFSRGS